MIIPTFLSRYAGRKKSVWTSQRTDCHPEVRIFFDGVDKIKRLKKLNLPVPERMIDLKVEYLNQRGEKIVKGEEDTFQAALKYYGIEHKPTNIKALESLHDAVTLLYTPADYSRALLRGEYIAAVAEIEMRGIPINIKEYTLQKKYTPIAKQRLINDTRSRYNVYERQVFKEWRFRAWLKKNHIPWPTDNQGELILNEDTFDDMAIMYPVLKHLAHVKKTVKALGNLKLTIEGDRNTAAINPFGAVTGRNTPSSNRWVYGLPRWCRYIIQPPPGKVLIHLDWSQHEIGIAAALSQDPVMMEAYKTGDFYSAFARENGEDPTKPGVRDKYKKCAIAVSYGMGRDSLATWMNTKPKEANQLLRLHRETYKEFWSWLDSYIDHAIWTGRASSVFGWTRKITEHTSIPSIQNFPMQANGAEMLRIAATKMVKEGLHVCTLIHDAILIEAEDGEEEETEFKAEKKMKEASEIVLKGFALRTDHKVIRKEDSPPQTEIQKIIKEVIKEEGNCNPKYSQKEGGRP